MSDELLDRAMGEAFAEDITKRRPVPPPNSIVAKPLIAGRYELLRTIATGGMGLVHLARDTAMNRDVALKVIRPEFKGSARTRGRFLREATIAGQLQHPGVVPVYELGTDSEGDVFLTMRPIVGQTLLAKLDGRQQGGEALMSILRGFEQVCQTMAYAHAQGIVHRDLKPDNIMIGTFGEVQVLDWGLAKPIHAADPEPDPNEASPVSPELSSAGSVLGTPMYMSPEQATGDLAAIDERSDVFSLGAILCEILTGHPLYEAEDAGTAVSRAAKADLDEVYLRLAKSGADAELCELAKDCLQKSKNDRPRHAGDVAKRVAAYLAGSAERAQQAEVRAAAARVKAVGERRARWLVTALAAVVLLLAAGIAYTQVQRLKTQKQAAAESERLLAEAVDRAARKDWAGAQEAAERAAATAAKSGSHSLAQRTLERVSEFRAQRQEQDVIAKVEKVRDRAPGPPEQMEAAYREAFAGAGIDVRTMDGADIGGKVAAQAEPIRVPLLEALDDWASRLPPEDRLWRKLMEASTKADADPWRTRLRQAMLTNDTSTILEMAKALPSTPQSPQSYHLMGQGIHRSGLPYEVERAALSEGQRRHPGDFWLNFTLAHRSLEQDGELPLAERHARIASALKPLNADARVILAISLVRQGEMDEARSQLGIALERLQEHSPPWEAAQVIRLQAEGKPEEAKRFARDLEERGVRLPPWAREKRPEPPPR